MSDTPSSDAPGVPEPSELAAPASPVTTAFPAPSLPPTPARARAAGSVPPTPTPTLTPAPTPALQGASPQAVSSRRVGRVGRYVLGLGALVAVVGAGSFALGFWDSGDTVTTAIDDDASQGEPARSTADEPTAGATPTDAPTICAEFEKVQRVSNEMALITSGMFQEMVQQPDAVDEGAVLAGFRDMADLMDDSLVDLLATYDAAAQLAPADLAADLRIVADGTAVLTPAISAVFRDAQRLDDLDELDQVLATPAVNAAAIDAGTASLRIDEFTIPTCGIQFSN